MAVAPETARPVYEGTRIPRADPDRAPGARGAARERRAARGQLRPEPSVDPRRAAADRRARRRGASSASRASIGYLHTGFEKNDGAEDVVEGDHRTRRGSTTSPSRRTSSSSCSRSRSCSTSRCPPKATWMRMLLCELNRIHSHLVWLGDRRARARRDLDVLVLLPRARHDPRPVRSSSAGCACTRATSRPAGSPRTSPPASTPSARKFVEGCRAPSTSTSASSTASRSGSSARKGVGLLSAADAIALGQSGPVLRALGRRLGPAQERVRTSAYGEVDFDVPVHGEGDVYDRYRVRMEEMRESTRIVAQCLDRLEPMDGEPWIADDRKVVLPPREELPHLDGVADPPLQDRHRGLPRPRGRGLRRRSSRRAASSAATSSRTAGRSRGASSSAPRRSSRSQATATCMSSAYIADMIAIVGSLDTVMGEVDR